MEPAISFLKRVPHARLFPARYDPETKQHKGLIRWGRESSSDPEVIKRWREKWPDAYFCVNLAASDLCVVDVDIKGEKQGYVSLEMLELMHGPMPETLLGKTPSGGLHFFYTGAVKSSVEKLGAGIDTPVMVPLPGQVVPGKGAYQIIEEREVTAAPGWIKETVGRPRIKEEKHHEPATDWDQPHNIAEAAVYAQTAPAALEGGGGDNRTYTVACHIRDYAVSQQACLDLMLRYYNPRCQPPWSVDHLQTKIQNAYRYANSQAGEQLPEADFDPVLINTFGIYRLTDFSGPAPARKWVVEGWLPESELTSLYGPPGGGKSLLALQLSLAVSTGSVWLGMQTEKMPVLIVACEDCADELHRRVDHIKKDPAYAFSDALSSIEWYGWPRVGKINILARSNENKLIPGPFLAEVETQVKNMPAGPKLLIFDTIADIYAGNESDRAMVNAFLKSCLGRLQTEYDATILVLGHPAKSENSEYSGSTAWDGGVRSRWILIQHENKNLTDHRVLVRAKANYGQRGDGITLQWIDGVFQCVKENEIVDPVFDTNCNLIMEVIKQQADKKAPVSQYSQGTLPIAQINIKGASGDYMSVADKKKCIAQLIMEGSVIERKNAKHKNGLYPA